MQNFTDISWFRLMMVMGLSVATSLAMFGGDERVTRGELFTTLIQAVIVGFSFLQCPEMAQLKRRINYAKRR